VLDRAPERLRGRLALAIGLTIYKSYRQLLDSNRWQRLANAGARPQRLLWASTSTKDPTLPDTLYVEGLAAPHTISTIPDSTLLAFDDHGQVRETLSADGGDAEVTLAQFASAGIDREALAATLQSDGADTFVEAWNDLLQRIDDQVAALRA
jgi:transaldolase